MNDANYQYNIRLLGLDISFNELKKMIIMIINLKNMILK